jgi:hypothetical protein
MGLFLLEIKQQFNEVPEKVLLNAIQFNYQLDDIILILYIYFQSLQDPYLDKTIYIEKTKKQSLRYIVNKLFAIYGHIISEKNKTDDS